jgi:hypothetical protein
MSLTIWPVLIIVQCSVTSENRTPVGLAKTFGIMKFPEFRSLEFSEQSTIIKHQLFYSKTWWKLYEADKIKKVVNL